MNAKLEALRAAMQERGLAALVVPSADPHQSEYMAEHWQARAWLTGFTGSAGTAVVTRDRAMVWTDFRYWIQAQAQMDGFELVRQGEEGVLSYDAWLADHLAPGQRIGMDGRLITISEARKLKTLFQERALELDTGQDLITPLWQDRPPLPATPAFELSPAYAGQTRQEKLAAIREKLADAGADAHLMVTLDDIAWALNLRGADAHLNPVNLAYVLVEKEEVRLFINPEKLPQDLVQTLAKDQVVLAPYDGIEAALAAISPGTRVLLDPDRLSIHLLEAVHPGAKILEKANPAVGLKAVKNAVERDWLETTAIKDGRAVVRFLYWLSHEAGGQGRVTETSAALKMREFRSQEADFFKDSFDAIMAWADHSAMCHYRAEPGTDKIVTGQGMFLMDSGGNYLTGTTDITRTLYLGRPGDQEKKDYTLVLKGHIGVATARFPQGTRGYQIDTLARNPLWQQGLDFGHGTGHGVGFFLSVHEGPARISPHPLDQALKPGMLLTNEPGIYREGQYGIRLENMVLVTEDKTTGFGRFLKFHTLTLCHFERDLIDPSLLSPEEIAWVDAYHARVYEALAPGLATDVGQWLAQKTLPL